MSDIISGLVSTIIPVFNRPRMLREAVESVLNQTYRPIEIIIVDDGSTDDTPNVARALQSEHSGIVRVHFKENSGAGPTREIGRRLARGEFIQYLDSDDLLRPKKFELMVRALRDNLDCGAAYGYICVQRGGMRTTQPYKGSGESRETLFPWLLSDRWWNTNTPLYRRSVTDAVGPWSDLKWGQDWEHDGRVAALGTKLVQIKDWVSDERQHNENRQTNNADWREPERLRARYRLMESLFRSAEKAEVEPENPHREHLTRWIFMTARHFAYAGLPDESNQCLELARRSAGTNTNSAKGFRLFASMTRFFGYRLAGSIFVWIERKKRSAGPSTLKESFTAEMQWEPIPSDELP